MDFIHEICKQNATKEVAPIIHQFLKIIFFESFTRVGVHKQIRYVLLPALWRDHMAIERQKQKKLIFLAKVLDETGRHMEAHVVRIIVKPYIRDLRPKMAEIKLRTVYLLRRTDKPDDGTDVYVGSTSMTLKERLLVHSFIVKTLKKGYENNKLYVRMREVGLYNWEIIPLLSFTCGKKTIREFEKKWVKILCSDLNSFSPITNKKEYNANYYESNKDVILQKKANYYELNKDVILHQRANYRKLNKDAILKKQANHRQLTIQNKVHHCDVCDKSFRSIYDLKKHLDTLKHQYTYLNSVD